MKRKSRRPPSARGGAAGSAPPGPPRTTQPAAPVAQSRYGPDLPPRYDNNRQISQKEANTTSST
eukprot:scaffold127306_cov30-Prasinocladus_malaysianus.AAC.2